MNGEYFSQPISPVQWTGLYRLRKKGKREQKARKASSGAKARIDLAEVMYDGLKPAPFICRGDFMRDCPALKNA
jgi:hypothetical protein